MSVGSIQQSPLFGFKTEYSYPNETFCDRLKFNAWRVSSYVPLISWVGASIKLWESAKIVFKAFFYCGVMLKGFFIRKFLAREFDFKEIIPLLKSERDEVKRIRGEAVKKFGADSLQVSGIEAKYQEIEGLYKDLFEGEMKNFQFFIELKKRIEMIASTRSEFYSLCEASVTDSQASTWGDLLLTSIEHGMDVTVDQMEKIQEVGKEYTLHFIASMSRVLFFEIMPIGWILFPFDLCCTAYDLCCAAWKNRVQPIPKCV